jgi:DNA-binding transcriptional LysR family regulator
MSSATPFLDNPLRRRWRRPPTPLARRQGAHPGRTWLPDPFLLREDRLRYAPRRRPNTLRANGLHAQGQAWRWRSNEAIRDLVASGMGLTILSRQALGGLAERDGLVFLDVAGFPLKRKWSVVHLRTKVLSLPAKAFLDDLLHSGAPRPELLPHDGL